MLMLQAIPIHDRLVLFFFFALVILGVLTPMPTFQRHIMFNAHVFCWLAAPTVRRSGPSIAHTIALTCPPDAGFLRMATVVRLLRVLSPNVWSILHKFAMAPRCPDW